MTLLADIVPPPDPSLLGAGLRMLAALALLGAAAWVVLRWRKHNLRNRRDLCVLDRAFLARGAGVALVSVEGRRLLLGVSNDGVRLLTDLERDDPAPADDSFEAVLTGSARDAREDGP